MVRTGLFFLKRNLHPNHITFHLLPVCQVQPRKIKKCCSKFIAIPHLNVKKKKKKIYIVRHRKQFVGCDQTEHRAGMLLTTNTNFPQVINPLLIPQLKKAGMTQKRTLSLIRYQLKQLVLIFGEASLQCLLPGRWGAADTATAEAVAAKSLRPPGKPVIPCCSIHRVHVKFTHQ